MKQLQCPHYATISGLERWCMKGKFPVNCETCDCKDKHYIEVKTSINSTDQQIPYYECPKPQAYTITHDEMLDLYDRARAKLMKLSKEELIEELIGKREEVGMPFI